MDSRTGFIDVNGSGLDLIYLYEPRTSGPAGITTYISQTYSQDLGSIFYMNANLGGLGLTGATGTNCGYKNSFGIDLGSMFCVKGTVAPLVIAFTPLSVSNCQLWLDANDVSTITKDGSNVVSQWNDKSGNSRNATNHVGTTISYNATAFNSRPTIQLAAGGMVSSVPSGTFGTSSSPGAITCFVIFQKSLSGTQNTYEALITRTNNNLANPFDIYNTLRIQGITTNLNINNATDIKSLTSNTLIAFTIEPSRWNEYLNGTQTLTNVYINTIFYDDANSTKLYIGTRTDKVTLFTGNISEVIVYNRVLTTTERQNVEGYLAKKWGLQPLLPTTHPYYNSLVLYYPFNSGDIVSSKLANYATGTAVYDATVGSQTTIDTVTTRTGGGGSLFTNGSSEGYVAFPTVTTTLNGLTISLWTKATVAAPYFNTIVQFRIADTNPDFISLNISNFYVFNSAGSTNQLAITNPNNGNWTHYVLTLQYTYTSGGQEYGNWFFYTNGAPALSSTTPLYYPRAVSRNKNFLGKDTTSSEWCKGNFDDFRLYHRTLNSTEVSNLYTANDPGPQLGLLPFLPTGCVGLFACKWVNNGYSGPILKLRKSSDTGGASMLDFYIDRTGTVITTGVNGTGTSLATWLGTDTAYVYAWYDQSGQGNHATQTISTAYQPKLVLFNGLYTVYFYTSGGADPVYMVLTKQAFATGNNSFTIISKIADTTLIPSTGFNFTFSTGINGTAQKIQQGFYNRDIMHTWYGGNGVIYTPTWSNNLIVSCDYNSASPYSKNIYLNGSSTPVVTYTTGATALSLSYTATPDIYGCIGAYGGNYLASTTTIDKQYCLIGSISHLSLYNTVLGKTDRQIIENVDELVWNGYFSQSITTPQAVSSLNYVNNWTVSSTSTFFLATTADTTYTRGSSTTSPFVALPTGTTQFLVSSLTTTVSTHNIKQSVNIPAAGIYTLTFYHNGKTGTNPYVTTHTLTVGLASKTVVSALSTTNTGWQLFTGSVALSSTDVGYKDLTLTFTNSAATNSSFFITGVALNYVGPAAGTGLLASLPTGSVGLFACKWVNGGYVGPILRLRKSTDTTGASPQDFFMDKTGYQIGTLPNGTGTSLATWLGAAPTAFVVTWYDQSLQFRHAIQPTTTLQPFYDSTNKYVDFSQNKYFALPDSTIPTGDSPYTFCFKYQRFATSASGAQYNGVGLLLSGGIDTGDFNGVRFNGIGFWNVMDNTTFNKIYDNATSLPNWNIGGGAQATIAYDNTSSARTIKAYLNGSNLYNITPSRARNTGSTTNYLGTGNIAQNYPLNAPLYDLCIFNTLLGDTDRKIMEGIDLLVFNGYFSQTTTGQVSTTGYVDNWTVSTPDISNNDYFVIAKTDDATYTRGTSTTSPYIALPTGVSQFLVSRLTTTNVAVSHNITQSVIIPAVGIYTLTFYHAGRTGTNTYSTNHTLAVDIGTQNLVSALQTTTSATASSVGWQLFTGSVAITSAGTKDLKFTFTNSSTSATDSSYYITGVVLNYVGPAVIPTTSLVFSLTFGSSTLPTTDLTGGFTLTTITNATYPSTPAMVLDGTRGYVLATDIGTGLATNFTPNTASFSRCFWLKKNATGQGNTLTSPRYPIYVSTGNKLQIDLNYTGNPVTTVLDTTDRGQVWVHYVFTYDSTSKICILYVNGNAVANGTTGAIEAENNTLCIGNYNTSTKLFGGNQYFDNIYCYSRALTSTEVLLIYFNGTTNL